MKKLIGGGLVALALSLAVAPNASAAEYNQNTVDRFIATVNQETDQWGTRHVPVHVADLHDDTIIAATRNGAITINLPWAQLTPEQFDAAVGEDIAAGYQPGGCEGIRAVAIHEFGHVLDQRDGAHARKVLAVAVSYDQVGTDLHGYAFEDGKINPGEAVAVSFQAVECGSATPTEQSIYNLLVS